MRACVQNDDLTTQRQLQSLTMDHTAVVAWLNPVAHTILAAKPLTTIVTSRELKIQFCPVSKSL